MICGRRGVTFVTVAPPHAGWLTDLAHRRAAALRLGRKVQTDGALSWCLVAYTYSSRRFPTPSF